MTASRERHKGVRRVVAELWRVETTPLHASARRGAAAKSGTELAEPRASSASRSAEGGAVPARLSATGYIFGRRGARRDLPAALLAAAGSAAAGLAPRRGRDAFAGASSGGDAAVRCGGRFVPALAFAVAALIFGLSTGDCGSASDFSASRLRSLSVAAASASM